MEISIKTNFPDVVKAMARLREEVGQKALASALNKTIAIARTAMTREIPAEFMVTAGYVRQRLRITRATARKGKLVLTAELAASNRRGRSANVIAFVTSAPGRKSARGKASTQRPLFVKIKRQGGKKALMGKHGQGGFIGNKGRTVFERIPGTTMGSRSRYGGTEHAERIRSVTTIDVTQMFNTKRINAKVIATVKARFADIFANEARFFLARADR